VSDSEREQYADQRLIIAESESDDNGSGSRARIYEAASDVWSFEGLVKKLRLRG
jgi:hypothetical protein